jgi:5-methylcytosine-specific restriction endonuclease McrA
MSKDTRYCVVCGDSFTTYKADQLCCGLTCSQVKRVQTRTINKPSTCQQCGKDYLPKEAGRDTYCSRECYFEAIKAKPKVKELLPAINCKQCGNSFIPTTRVSRLCSDDCKRVYSRIKCRDYNRVKHGTFGTVTKSCPYCGAAFTMEKYGSQQDYCTPTCRKKAYRRTDVGRQNHRSVKARRRARLVGAEVSPVTWLDVLIRDRWICAICGAKINRAAKFPHPQSATIDHIIPLAKGGPHSMANLQAAHFICNATKSDQGGGQLRLAI